MSGIDPLDGASVPVAIGIALWIVDRSALPLLQS